MNTHPTPFELAMLAQTITPPNRIPGTTQSHPAEALFERAWEVLAHAQTFVAEKLVRRREVETDTCADFKQAMTGNVAPSCGNVAEEPHPIADKALYISVFLPKAQLPYIAAAIRHHARQLDQSFMVRTELILLADKLENLAL